MDRIRIAILGTGAIARTHARACRAVPGAELVMAANWRPESLARFAREWDIARTSTRFEDVAADPQVDAVINTLPNFLHKPETIRMLRAGKHVLLEKPMAMNAVEAQEIIDVAAEAGRTLMVGHMWRFDNEVNWLRSAIAAGVIGDVVRTHGYHLNPPFVGPSDGWMVRQSTAGGGPVMDMAIHSVDTTRYLLDEALPVRVYAEAATRYSCYNEVEDVATFMVHWSNGVHSVFVTANYPPYQEAPEGAIDVWATAGHGRLFPSAMNLTLGSVMGAFTPSFPVREQQVDYPMYQKQLEHFVDCIRTGRQPMPGGREGLIAMKVVDAVYESARTGKSVDI
jgi:predicted dehydrogenase